MSIKQQTFWPTEADFEADLQAALHRAFPWLPPGSIKHQTKFSFTWGRATIEVDGREQNKATARADILLYSGERPLAVLELKRPGHELDDSDIAQGLSYARMLHPRPPLVVVTNGKDLSLLETHTGNEWKPSNPGEEAFSSLLQKAAHVATGDLRLAVDTLMGSNPAIWVQAIRQTSALAIGEMSGEWGDQLLPFVPGFLIPRKATAATVALLKEGKRLILVEGPPLAGKSNVLRELAAQTAEAEDLAVLFVEAEAGVGAYRTIAGALSSALSWPVTDEEARAWLMRLSKGAGPALVVAVDGLNIERDAIRSDIDDLTSHLFGRNVRVAVTLDDSVAEKIVLNSTGRKLSALGRRASRVGVGPLDDDEFQTAAELFWSHRLGIMKGGDKSPELRICWVLRAVASHFVSDPNYANESLAAAVPPLLGPELIQHARDRFQDDELRRLLRQTAEAVLRDAEDRTRPIGLILVSMATFLVRRKTLQKFLEHAEIEKLITQGFLRPAMHDSGDALLVVRAPELLASEAADIVGIRIAKGVKSDPKATAVLIAKVAEGIPLGDIVAAQALLDAALLHGSLTLNFIMELIALKPERQAVKSGTRAAMYFPGIGTMDVTFERGGSISVNIRGKRIPLQEADGETPYTYSHIHSWLVLSHLAGHAFELEEGGEVGPRVDPMILLEVGTCPIVLRAVVPDPEMSAVLTHQTDEGEVVCEKAGMVEPITLSIFKFLSSVGPQAEDWIDEAVERKSFPLLMRLHTALEQLVNSADKAKAGFAQRMLNALVLPALSEFPKLH